MARGNERTWTKESLTIAYGERAHPSLAERLIEILNRVQSLGRLILEPRVTPAFGIAGNAGRRVLSIREHRGGAIKGNISLFPAPERYVAPGEYETLRDRLQSIANSDAVEQPGSWDLAAVADLSDAAYSQFLEVLDWLGPVPASDAWVELPSRADTVISRIVRDSALVRRLKQIYDNRCQLCGVQVSGLHGWTYAEAHHVRPLGEPHNGPDAEDNLLILCPNHHAACDFGAVELKLSDLHFAPGHTLRPEHLRYHNQTIVRRPG